MERDKPVVLGEEDACVDAVLERVGRNIVLGLPLGLGKPVRFANALYRRARQDSSIQLRIITAISMLAPQGKSSLERRFLEPFVQRLYGEIPELEYARDVVDGKLPGNVQVSEFFFKAGSFLNHQGQQQNYVCTNYTHAVRDLLAQGVNVLAQMVAPSADMESVSVSCNPDLTLDLIPVFHERAAAGEPVMLVGETNRQLPYLGHHAELPITSFDVVLDRQKSEYGLFPVPQMAISPADHAIGFYASALLKDGGTLQVGIGSLGAALVHSAILRHSNNQAWRAVYDNLRVAELNPVAVEIGGDGTFEQGLYGCSEMMVDGFVHLMNAGILKRKVYDHAGLQTLVNEGKVGPEISLGCLDALRDAELIDSPLRARDVQWLIRYGIFSEEVQFKGGRLVVREQTLEPDLDDPEARQRMEQLALGDSLKGGVVMHGGFYLGPGDFYQQLRELTPEQRDSICMTSVNYINHLYDHTFGDQRLKAAQRKDSRFINSAMMYTLEGEAVSDGLEDGRVVSGVGGQYNFVAMAHETPGARSILSLRSTRSAGGKVVSNIVFNYGHCTIPRHLRDIVITEYGVADLRSKSDQQVYLEMIRIADSRFQPELLKQAKKAGKVDAAFQLPASWSNNTPESLKAAMRVAGVDGLFPAFPFGCDFTDDELVLGKALKTLKAATATGRGKIATLFGALRVSSELGELQPLLQRMGLDDPKKPGDKLNQRLLILALNRIGLSSAKGNTTS
ncbi:acetyl-CoA hydrolase/transferase C-terminal domain-containing protein [Marinobacter zhejiangensis]|uniref:Acetyl-CoA hydrolase/transferase C-terminal domain-containing protein n=1 Tax=Marinobacter zhejiangensis TaxID=488535 RepID=A0A1I4N857_9GAMM|nr:acetyl-CoA hydrolase/transferase C-terminal domain-containing protein [Marinobacter zhejiangensis]SFM11487.1 Acetyl-CoA hydrolase/transferase C-terminal domain-containing protein [Marinobacter zhejiangensis]